jgi:hypothetical protein
MVEPRRELDLPLESSGPQGGGELAMQDLDRDLPVVPEVVRKVDYGHAATTELAIEPEVVRKIGRV